MPVTNYCVAELVSGSVEAVTEDKARKVLERVDFLTKLREEVSLSLSLSLKTSSSKTCFCCVSTADSCLANQFLPYAQMTFVFKELVSLLFAQLTPSPRW